MGVSPARPLPILLSPELLAEADRILTICNACRYCEGVCPVFPALERRETFVESDIVFLGNLCHDCRACYYVCPFTAPHEFNVNVPAVMSEVRITTYAGYAWPTALSKALNRGWRGIGLVTGLLLLVILLAVTRLSSTGLVGARSGAGSFYEVVPWLAMFVPATLMTLYGFGVVVVAAARFWRATRTPLRSLVSVRAAVRAGGDAMGLRNLGGGGPGCYTHERPSHRRRIAHSLVFYGFLATFLSTVAAAVQQDVFGWLPPYPALSVPVVSGTVGGVAIIVGCIDLIRLKVGSDGRLAARKMLSLDYAFLIVLIAISANGLLLLVLRETVLMPIMLATHLALVGAFYITAPYGKFAHFIYRYGALVQDRMEVLAETVHREAPSA